jgi:hypothetical protein
MMRRPRRIIRDGVEVIEWADVTPEPVNVSGAAEAVKTPPEPEIDDYVGAFAQDALDRSAKSAKAKAAIKAWVKPKRPAPSG